MLNNSAGLLGGPTPSVYKLQGGGSSFTDLVLLGSDHLLLQVTVQSGLQYAIQVASYSISQGDFLFNLLLVPPPANDAFENGTVLTGQSSTVSGSSVGSTYEFGEPNSQSTGGSVWFRKDPLGIAGVLVVTVLPLNTHVVSVFRVSGGQRAEMITSASSVWSGGFMHPAFPVLSTEQYAIQLSTELQGAYTLSAAVTTVPANDMFDDATEMASAGNFSSDSTGATFQVGELSVPGANAYATTWYAFAERRMKQLQ